MSFTFRRAVRENVSVIVGLAGSSGSGKSFSAMRLATGLSGGKRFCVIDTEAGRALAYADRFDFDHGRLDAPFRPQAYIDAIFAADAAGYPVIVVDSASHIWAGQGGCAEWHDEILAEMVERKRVFAESKGWAFDEWKTREANNIAAWIEPKVAHRKFVSRLVQLKAHLILCLRAEDKIEITKDATGKTVIQPKQSPTGYHGWTPICEKALPYELTASFVLTADAPGVPKPIKLQDQHRPFFPLDRPIDENAGRDLARWASGAGVVDHAKAIADATTLAALAAAWKAIPKPEAHRFVAAKDARKAALEAPAHDAQGVVDGPEARMQEFAADLGERLREATADELPDLADVIAGALREGKITADAHRALSAQWTARKGA